MSEKPSLDDRVGNFLRSRLNDRKEGKRGARAGPVKPAQEKRARVDAPQFFGWAALALALQAARAHDPWRDLVCVALALFCLGFQRIDHIRAIQLRRLELEEERWETEGPSWRAANDPANYIDPD
jgi:hypothetical protein